MSETLLPELSALAAEAPNPAWAAATLDQLAGGDLQALGSSGLARLARTAGSSAVVGNWLHQEPGLLDIFSAADLGDIEASGERRLSVTFAPDGSVATSHDTPYQFLLHVMATNHEYGAFPSPPPGVPGSGYAEKKPSAGATCPDAGAPGGSAGP